ncbi:uncharacterized protein Bfra_011495 [Botrytis fragariae]|uniref:Uncharacterized protein n=1 Tax=Botrytis fragariae TaxID=1964551 RepID=A0A8H6EKM1_9HELO|nr:uncharacterized protein Bfra_011495 [Botrytis fragariae]KAF5875732.1 hypothetical protein Bfra_011495 [Botrytis fragariae]
MADNISTTACSKAASEKFDEFPLFSSFPVEIQCRIFKKAFPDPELIYWDFDIRLPHEKRMLMFSLTKTNITHYSLSCLHARTHMQSHSDSYRYLRMTVDTLSMSFTSFISLDMVGGRMTLDNITHLALIHCPALNTLYFVIDYGVGPATWTNLEYRQLVDISEGCMDLDCDFPRLKQSLNEEFRY